MSYVLVWLLSVLPIPSKPAATISGPTEVKVGVTVDFVVEVEAADELKGAKFRLYPKGKASYWRVLAEWGSDKPVPIFQSFEPGDYTITLSYWNGEEVVQSDHDFKVVGEEPGPDPDPDPDPDPEPTPATKIWVLWIYESDDVDDKPWVANITTSQKIRALGSSTVDLDFADDDGKNEEDKPDPRMKEWIDLIKEKGLELPQVIFVNEKGQLVHRQAWPQTVDACVELVKKHMPK